MTRRWVIGTLAAAFWVACSQPLPHPNAALERESPAERATVAGVEVPSSFDVQGHRGARGLKPESTLPSFEAALDARVKTLELDLHLAADDELVVWHDPILWPSKCRGPALEGADPARLPRIRTLTYAEIRRYVCDLNAEPERFPHQTATPTALAGQDFRIVGLADVFDFVERYAKSDTKTPSQRANAARIRFNLETKRVPDQPWTIDDDFDGSNPGLFERALVDAVRSHGLSERVTIQSFDHRSLAAIRRIAPDLELAALTDGPVDLAAISRTGAHIWSPHHETLATSLVAQAHEHNLRVVPWTINDAGRVRELVAMGVDGIITDLGNDVAFDLR